MGQDIECFGSCHRIKLSMCYKVGIGGYGIGIRSWSGFQMGFSNSFLYVGLLRIYVEF